MRIKDKIAQIKEESALMRVLLNKYFIATLSFLLIIVVLDNNNAIKWIGNKYHIYQQEELIEQYRQDIKYTDEKIKELTSDRDSLEKYAREHYYFHNKNEEVYIVE